ncbi:MAG TPA: branched-chain amino acid ABC transporter permease, partial [Actinomycetota bacterium]|nr:branched-chain amino acid ABC transporter permease [Actinomycetota bacterium]
MAVTTDVRRRITGEQVASWIGLALAVGVMVLVIIGIRTQFWAQTRNGLTLGAIYAMMALGYTMVYGVLQLINFAHSEVFMIGTVVTLFAFRSWFAVEEPLGGVALIVVIIGGLIPAMAVSGLTAVALERVAYRPLRKRGAPRLAFLISAIGASFAISYAFNLMDGNHYILDLRLPGILGPAREAAPVVMQSETAFTVFDTPIQNTRILVILVAVGMMFLLDRIVRKTKLGRGIRAVAQDAETASLMGVNIDRVIVYTFLIGGIMAGAAGTLWGVFFRTAAWNIGFLPGIKAFTAAVLGGIGNLRGAMAGGVLLGLVEAYGSAAIGAQWKDVIAFVVLVAVLMFRPTGIFGERVGA